MSEWAGEEKRKEGRPLGAGSSANIVVEVRAEWW